MEFKQLLEGFLYGVGGSFAGFIVGAIGAEVLPLNFGTAGLGLIGASLGFLVPAVSKWFEE